MVNVQKHKLLLSLLLCTITGIFTACTDDTESISNHNGTPLSINVGVDTPQSRALIAGNSLPDGSQIGVSVVDASGTDYQDQDYNNVCYQAVTEDGTQKWKVQSRSDILLSGEAGTLYAYYPWTAAATDFTQIAVNMDEADQKDWMVAEPITNLSDAQATAAVKMKHMLTNFKLSFYKDNYSGKGEVTAVTIRSNAFATTGTLDATTGTFAAYGDGHTLTRTFATTLGTDKTAATACNVMVVPNTVAAPVTISVTVDGNTYSSVTSSLTLEKAKSCNYAMKLSSTGLSITEVTLTDWQTTDLGNTEFEPEIPPVTGTIDLLTAGNGVYAIAQNGLGVAIDDADESCIGVALIVTDAPTPQRFMIEKNGEKNMTYKTADNNWQSSWSNYYFHFSWGGNATDHEGLDNYVITGAGGNDSMGYLPLLDGTFKDTPHLSTDYKTWTTGALSDYDGEGNTAIVKTISDNGTGNNVNNFTPISVLLTYFNADGNAENFGHKDWYIPACGQLGLIYLNVEKINETLNKIGGYPFGYAPDRFNSFGYYMSSTEFSAYYDWIIEFEGSTAGRVYLRAKAGQYSGTQVRLIRAIK